MSCYILVSYFYDFLSLHSFIGKLKYVCFVFITEHCHFNSNVCFFTVCDCWLQRWRMYIKKRNVSDYYYYHHHKHIVQYTITNLLYLCNPISLFTMTSWCHLDFSSFAVVPNTLLLCQLSAYSLSGSYVSWLLCYITSGYSFVWIHSIYSPPSAVLSGVPEGSVLGEIWYVLIYIYIYIYSDVLYLQFY